MPTTPTPMEMETTHPGHLKVRVRVGADEVEQVVSEVEEHLGLEVQQEGADHLEVVHLYLRSRRRPETGNAGKSGMRR